KYQRAQQKSLQEERALEPLRAQPAVTLDGKSFKLEANLDSPEELKAIVALQADGIGLFRTEYLFLNRAVPPTEEEQTRAYTQVVKALEPRTVVIRTADIGGD